MLFRRPLQRRPDDVWCCQACRDAAAGRHASPLELRAVLPSGTDLAQASEEMGVGSYVALSTPQSAAGPTE